MSSELNRVSLYPLIDLLAFAREGLEQVRPSTEPPVEGDLDPELTEAIHVIAVTTERQWREANPGKAVLPLYRETAWLVNLDGPRLKRNIESIPGIAVGRDQVDAFVLAQVTTWIEMRLEQSVRPSRRRRTSRRRHLSVVAS